MIENLFQLLSQIVNNKQADEDTATEHSINLAAAALMLEVSRSDTTKQSIELDTIGRILAEKFLLPADQIETLIAAADTKVEAATDFFQFTQLINQAYSYSEKIKLVTAMWQVAYADGRLEALEDQVIRRISGLLHVAHEDFMKAKLTEKIASSGQ